MKTVLLAYFCLMIMASNSYAGPNSDSGASRKLRGKTDIFEYGSNRIIEPIDEYQDMSRLSIYGLIKEEACVTENCPLNTLKYEWNVGIWSECSNELRTRSVDCVDSTSHIDVADSLCFVANKPANSASCGNGEPTNTPDLYAWIPSSYGECDNGCGSGYKSRVISCYDKTYNKVDDSYCIDAEPYPDTQLGDTGGGPNSKPCYSIALCEYHWVVGSWSECSDNKQTRPVSCHDGSGQVVEDDLCYYQAWHFPDTISYECESRNSYRYEYGSWGECFLRNKYQSVRQRTAKCVDGNGQEVEFEICEMEGLYPEIIKDCAEWVLSNWSECTPEKIRTRTLHCGNTARLEPFDDYMCADEEKPNVALSESCEMTEYKWYTHPWEARCNDLPAVRKIECRHMFTGKTVLDSLCDESSKPNEISGPEDSDAPSGNCSYEWHYGNWEKCVMNNGNFEHVQNVTCARYVEGELVENSDINDSYCEQATGESNPMNSADPVLCQYGWNVGEWGVCDHQTLTKTRTVQCKEEHGEVFDDSVCLPQGAKELSTESCELDFSWNYSYVVDRSLGEECQDNEISGYRRDLPLCWSWTPCPQDGLIPFRNRSTSCIAVEKGVHVSEGHIVPDSVCLNNPSTTGSYKKEYMICEQRPFENNGWPHVSGCNAGCNKPGSSTWTINDCRWINRNRYRFWPALPHEMAGYDASLCLSYMMYVTENPHPNYLSSTDEITEDQYLSELSKFPYINQSNIHYTSSDHSSLTYQVPCIGSCDGAWVISGSGQCVFDNHFSSGGFMEVGYACENTATGERFSNPDMMPCDPDLKPASTQIGCYYNISDPTEMARINGLIAQYVVDPSQYNNGQIVPGSELEALMYGLNGYQP